MNQSQSNLTNLYLFTGCNNFNGGHEDEICEAQNEVNRLVYDSTHHIFMFLEPQYSKENHHICHITISSHITAHINCGVGNLQTNRSHKLKIGRDQTSSDLSRQEQTIPNKTLYQIENKTHHHHRDRRTRKSCHSLP